MENIKWLWGVMDKRYHKWHILGLIISAVTSLMLLINPYLTMRLMDDVIVAQNPEPLVGLLLTMLIVKVTREGLRYLMVVLLEHSSQNTLMNLRMRLFTRLQYQDMRFFDIHRTGDLMTRLSADTDWCRHFLAYIDYVAVDSIVMFVSSSIYLFSVNWKLALAMVCVTPLLMIITKVYSKGARRMFVDMRDKMSDMNAKAQENIAANRVVKAFAREEYEENRFDEVVKGKKEEELTPEEKSTREELSKKIVTLRDERNERLREIGGENRLVKQIIDLALLTNGMLKGKNLTDFIQRSISLIEK